MPVYPLSDWGVSLARLTAFPVITEQRRDVHWWEQIMGTEPDVRTNKTAPPQVEIAGPFERTETG